MNSYRDVIISNKGETFIKNGQNKMYANNLESYDSNINDGDIVNIRTLDHEYLATGFFNSQSHIAVRILSRNEDEIINKEFFKKRLLDAYQYRKTVVENNLDNCRLVFGDADFLPGLVIDRYNDILVSQISILGLERIKDDIYHLMLEILLDDHQNVSRVYERNDVKIRQKEGLTLYKGWTIGSGSTTTVIKENGLLLNVDVENGQKTGYFLDQKNNRLRVRNISKDKNVLDCFTHTGGFVLNAAIGNAKHVVGVDVSDTALSQARHNAKLNHLTNVEFVQADVFDYLETLKKGQYDIIILDPPAFTKSRSTVNQAYNGYKRINYLALKALKSGSYLITCTCSRYMEIDTFEDMLKQASSEANVSLKQISVSLQSKDHPTLEEDTSTTYLKFYMFQVIRS